MFLEKKKEKCYWWEMLEKKNTAGEDNTEQELSILV